MLLQSNSLQSKKQTARHSFRNTSETAKHHLISCQKRRKGTPKKGLTSLLKPYYKIETLPLPAAACCCLCWCLLLPAAACGCLLPAAACCSLLLPAAGAAAGGCCWTLKKGLTSLLKPYYKIETLPLPAAACCCLCWCLPLPAAACCCLLLPPKQETNSQTPFSKHIRNSKTPPNLVPKT